VTGSLQWRPTENSTLTLDALLAKFTNNRDETYLEVISFSRSGQGLPQTDVVNFQADDKGNLIKGTFDDVDARVEYRHDDLKTEFNQFTLTYDTKFGDAATSTSSTASRARSRTTRSRRPSRSIATTATATATTIRPTTSCRSSTTASIRPTRPTSSTAPATPRAIRRCCACVPARRSTPSRRSAPTSTTKILDGFKLRYGGDWKEFGFNSSEQRLFSRNLAATGTTYTAEAGFPLPAGVTVADVSRLITGFGRGPRPAGRHPDLVDRAGPGQAEEGHRLRLQLHQRQRRLPPERAEPAGRLREITEKDNAFYLQADFDYDLFNIPVRGNFGVRYVKTEQGALGHYNGQQAMSWSPCRRHGHPNRSRRSTRPDHVAASTPTPCRP
jgi:iron complex outermembrane receptor protein